MRLGRVRHVSKAGNWGSRLRQRLLSYDTVALTFLEGGIEYVVFDPSRVSSIKVHQVLHTSCSSSGALSVMHESSSGSFMIGTATDPHSCSNASSSSSGQSTYTSSSSSDSDDGTAEQPSSALCYQELQCRLKSCEDSSSSKPSVPQSDEQQQRASKQALHGSAGNTLPLTTANVQLRHEQQQHAPSIEQESPQLEPTDNVLVLLPGPDSAATKKWAACALV